MSDLISRQAVTKFLNDWLSCLFENCHKQSASDLKMIIKDFKNLPFAQPERKTGHWIEIGDEPYDEWECDVCGFTIDGSGCIDPEEYRDVYKFCPHCGSCMIGEQDG